MKRLRAENGDSGDLGRLAVDLEMLHLSHPMDPSHCSVLVNMEVSVVSSEVIG